jgi:hypothetical protein
MSIEMDSQDVPTAFTDENKDSTRYIPWLREGGTFSPLKAVEEQRIREIGTYGMVFFSYSRKFIAYELQQASLVQPARANRELLHLSFARSPRTSNQRQRMVPVFWRR